MLINIRGTSGSGKTTLVKTIISYYSIRKDYYKEKRKQPLYMTFHRGTEQPLAVIGHMNSPCGGCDTLKSFDEIFNLVCQEYTKGHHVLFEGMLLCSDTKRIVQLAKDTGDTVIISLTTPVDQCCDNIRKRREAKGDVKELNETNTRKRYDYEQKQIVKLQSAGVDIRTLVYADALLTVKQLLNL
jgi:predicted kinase